jgi:hypothetical protein
MAELELPTRTTMSDRRLADAEFTDEELAAQALAADPDVEVAADAISVWELSTTDPDGLLPAWYMPPPMSGGRRFTGWRRRVIIGVVAAFLLIDAAGLCSTYGWIVPA